MFSTMLFFPLNWIIGYVIWTSKIFLWKCTFLSDHWGFIILDLLFLKQDLTFLPHPKPPMSIYIDIHVNHSRQNSSEVGILQITWWGYQTPLGCKESLSHWYFHSPIHLSSQSLIHWMFSLVSVVVFTMWLQKQQAEIAVKIQLLM